MTVAVQLTFTLSLACMLLAASQIADAQKLRAPIPAPAPRLSVPWDTNISSWLPKTDASSYNPSTKDWSSVISACKQVGQSERRFHNKFIRAAFHDGLAVDVSTCNSNCVAADASVILNSDEMTRIENADFASAIKIPLLKIASFYDISASDVMAVCGAVAIEDMSEGAVKVISTGTKTFPVGRLDSSAASTANALPSPFVSYDELYAWWKARGFTAQEALALLGTHALDPKQGCLTAAGTGKCDPSTNTCWDVRMWKLKNHYFTDLMTPSITLVPSEWDSPPAVKSMTPAQFEAYRREETCKFTSKKFRDMRLAAIDLVRKGGNDTSADVPTATTWQRATCATLSATCPYPKKWYYINSDAQLGIAAQSNAATANEATINLKAAVRLFTNQASWYSVLPGAYIKMVSKYAAWANGQSVMISGRECPSKFVSDACPRNPSNPDPCKTCGPDGLINCPPCCRCSTAVAPSGSATRPPPPGPGPRPRN